MSESWVNLTREQRREGQRATREACFPFAGAVKRIQKAVNEIASDESQPRADRIFQIRLLARDLVVLESRMCEESDLEDLIDLAAMR